MRWVVDLVHNHGEQHQDHCGEDYVDHGCASAEYVKMKWWR